MKNMFYLLKIAFFFMAIFSSLKAVAESLDGDWYFQSGEIDGQLLESAMDLELVPDETWPIFRINGASLRFPFPNTIMTEDKMTTEYSYVDGKFSIVEDKISYSFSFDGENTELNFNFEFVSENELKVIGLMDENLILYLKKK